MDPNDINPDDPRIQDLISKAVEQGVAQKFEAELEQKVNEQLDPMRQKNKELLTEKKSLMNKLKSVPELPEDFDLTEYQELREERAKREEEKAMAEGNFEKLRKDMADKYSESEKKWNDQLTNEQQKTVEAQKRYQQYFLQNEITKAIIKADGIPDLLMSRLMNDVEFVAGEDGKPDSVRVVDSDGGDRIKDAGGGVYQISDLLDDLRNDPVWARAFKGSGATGGGANGSGAAAGGVPLKNPFKDETLNLTEQARLRREDIDTYNRLKAEAGK